MMLGPQMRERPATANMLTPPSGRVRTDAFEPGGVQARTHRGGRVAQLAAHVPLVRVRIWVRLVRVAPRHDLRARMAGVGSSQPCAACAKRVGVLQSGTREPSKCCR
jgi:hypothetical protein